MYLLGQSVTTVLLLSAPEDNPERSPKHHQLCCSSLNNHNPSQMLLEDPARIMNYGNTLLFGLNE